MGPRQAPIQHPRYRRQRNLLEGQEDDPNMHEAQVHWRGQKRDSITRFEAPKPVKDPYDLAPEVCHCGCYTMNHERDLAAHCNRDSALGQCLSTGSSICGCTNTVFVRAWYLYEYYRCTSILWMRVRSLYEYGCCTTMLDVRGWWMSRVLCGESIGW
jgi:hypothetical protein